MCIRDRVIAAELNLYIEVTSHNHEIVALQQHVSQLEDSKSAFTIHSLLEALRSQHGVYIEA